MKYFANVVDWKLLAAHLLDDKFGSKSAQIEKSCHFIEEDCLKETIIWYLRDGDVSWKKVIRSLNNANCRNIAAEICKDMDAAIEMQGTVCTHMCL